MRTMSTCSGRGRTTCSRQKACCIMQRRIRNRNLHRCTPMPMRLLLLGWQISMYFLTERSAAWFVKIQMLCRMKTPHLTRTNSTGNPTMKIMPHSISWCGTIKTAWSAKNWDFPHCWIWMKLHARLWHSPACAVMPLTMSIWRQRSTNPSAWWHWMTTETSARCREMQTTCCPWNRIISGCGAVTTGCFCGNVTPTMCSICLTSW